MDKDLAQGNIGSVGKYDVAFKDKKLVIAIEEVDQFGSTKFERSIPAKAVLDAIKAAIPGKVDDAVIDVIEAALLGE